MDDLLPWWPKLSLARPLGHQRFCERDTEIEASSLEAGDLGPASSLLTTTFCQASSISHGHPCSFLQPPASPAPQPTPPLGRRGPPLEYQHIQLNFLSCVLRGPGLGVIVVFQDVTKEERLSDPIACLWQALLGLD